MARPELLTERLRLVIAQPGLEAALARFYELNFPGHLDRWSPPPPPGGFSIDHWAARLPAFAREYEDGLSARWVLLAREAKAPEEVVGTCNLTQVVRGAFHAAYLGYQIGRSEEGRGLMAEALEAAIAHAFSTLRLHRIMANYRPENVRSERVLRRLGFVVEGIAREYLFIDGAWRDHVLASKTNAAFDPDWLKPATAR